MRCFDLLNFNTIDLNHLYYIQIRQLSKPRFMDKPQKKKYVEKVVVEAEKEAPKKQYQAKINDYIPKLKKKEKIEKT